MVLNKNNRTPNLSGKAIGIWRINSFAGYTKPVGVNKIRVSLWLCKCLCGNRQVVSYKSFISNKRLARWARCKKCGDRSRGNQVTKQGENGLKLLYGYYKFHSKKRQIPFKLEINQFAKLTSSNCFYCNSKPSQKAFYRGKNCLKSSVKTSIYSYNGIDRKNNNMGYTVSNSVPCCSTCNYMKRGHSVSRFINHIKKIVENNKYESTNIH